MSQCQLSVTLNGRHLKLPDIKAGTREQTWSGKGSVIKRVIIYVKDFSGLKREERPKTNLSRIEAARDFSLVWVELPFPTTTTSLLFTANVLLNTWAVDCTFQTLFSVILPWDIPIELQIVTKNILFTFSHGPFSVGIEWHIEVRVVYGGCQQCTESTFQIWCDKRRNPIHCPSKNAV